MSDEKPKLHLVPDLGPEPESEAEPSNLVELRAASPMVMALRSMERKHQAHVEDVRARVRAEEEARQLRAELASLRSHRAEGYGIRAELQRGSTERSLVERYVAWFERSPIECVLVTAAVAFAALKVAGIIWDLAMAAQRGAMMGELDRELVKLDARISEISADPRIIEAEVTNVHHHYPVKRETKVVERSVPGPRGDRGLPGRAGAKGPRGYKGEKGSRGPQGARGRDATQAMVNDAVATYLNKNGITFT